MFIGEDLDFVSYWEYQDVCPTSLQPGFAASKEHPKEWLPEYWISHASMTAPPHPAGAGSMMDCCRIRVTGGTVPGGI